MERESNSVKVFICSAGFSLALALCVALLYWLAFALTKPSLQEIDDFTNQPVVISAIVMCIVCFAISKARLEFSKILREQYYSLNCYPKRIKFIILFAGLISDVIFFAIFFALIDLDFITKYYDGLLPNSIIELIALSIFLVVDFIALFYGVGTWIKSEDDAEIQNHSMDGDTILARQSSQLVPTIPKFAAMRFLARTYTLNANTSPEIQYDYKLSDSDFPKKKLFWGILLYTFIFALIIILSKYIYQLAKLIWFALKTVVFTWQFGAVAIGLIIAVFFIRLMSALVKRIGFIKRLNSISSESNSIKVIESHPFKALFTSKSNRPGFDLRISVDEKEYSCKFITCKSKSAPVILDFEGNMFTLHAITFAGIKMLQHTTNDKYSFESENAKLLIVNPVSKFIYALKDGKLIEIDNGDIIGDYKIFTGTSFINALNRNCLDRTVSLKHLDD